METLTHSKRRAFMNCPRYFYLSYEQRLEPVSLKRSWRRGTAFGNCIHALQEADHMVVWNDEGAWAGEPDREQVILETIDEAYTGVHPVDQQDQDDIEFEQYALPLIVTNYIEIYNNRARRELEYDFPLRNPDTGMPSRVFRVGGKIDGLEVLPNGEVWIVEDKLVSQISQTTVQHIPLDLQTQEYVDAVIQAGFPMPGIKFRHTRWPSIRRKKGETVSEFCRRFAEDLNDRRDWYFHQERFFFPERLLDEFRRGRWQTAKNIMQARRSGVWVQNTTRCMDFGKCEFMPLCLQLPDAESLYRVREKLEPELTGGTNGSTT